MVNEDPLINRVLRCKREFEERYSETPTEMMVSPELLKKLRESDPPYVFHSVTGGNHIFGMNLSSNPAVVGNDIFLRGSGKESVAWTRC